MIGFGLSIFAIGLLVLIFSIVFGFFKSLWKFIVSAVELMSFLFFMLFDYIFITRKDKKTGRYQKQLRREYEEISLEEKRKERSRKEIVIGAMNFTSKMRVLYPLADEELFIEATVELPKDNCKKSLKEYERLIKRSHLSNLTNQSSYSSQSNKYNLSDLDNLQPIEIRSEKPITMSLFKIERDYVLHISNSQTNENTLLQTEDYYLIANYMVTILELQQNLKQLKESVRSIQLENIFNVKKELINDNNTIEKRF